MIVIGLEEELPVSYLIPPVVVCKHSVERVAVHSILDLEAGKRRVEEEVDRGMSVLVVDTGVYEAVVGKHTLVDWDRKRSLEVADKGKARVEVDIHAVEVVAGTNRFGAAVYRNVAVAEGRLQQAFPSGIEFPSDSRLAMQLPAH
jgi:hypothetical protein